MQAYLEDEKENITRIIKQMLAVGEIFKSENLQVTTKPHPRFVEVPFFVSIYWRQRIIMQYSTDQLVKEVENSIAEFKQYNQDYDEDSIRQQVWLFLVVNSN